MRNTLKLADFLLYSNLFVGFCASFFVLGYYSVDPSVPIDFNYLLIVFLSTIAVYSFHRWFSFNPKKITAPNLRNDLIGVIRPFLFIWALITGLSAAVLFYLQGNYNLQLAIFPIILSVLYLVPFYKNKRLRDFSYIKIYIVAAVWAWVAVIYPSIESNWDILDKSMLFAAQFLLIFGLILPLDYRDRMKDDAISVKTYALNLPLPKLKIVGVACFIFSFLIILVSTLFMSIDYVFLPGYLIPIIFAVLITIYYKGDEPDYFYTGFIDGILLVQGALLFITSFIVLS